ncbi:calcium-binding protein P-like [Pecten maximus]|uniref:calcium-binding protein P-like n=1 Tax=Pecten maximus TaxID=6579 RepID=UPI0014587EA3|nr:calcium-binding protein P-like [Pecten maximus]
MDFVDFEPNPEFDFSNMGGEDNKVQLDKSLDSQPSLTEDTKDDMSKMLANVGSLVHNKNQDVEVRGHAKQEPPSMDPGFKPKSRAPGAQLPGQYQLPTLPQTPRTQVFAPPDTLSPAVALSTFTPASHPVMSMSTVMTPTAMSGYPSNYGQTPGYMSPGQYSQALSGVYPPNHYGMPNGAYGGIPSPYMPQTPPGYPQGYQPMSPYGNYHGQQYGYPPYPYYPIPPPPGYPNMPHPGYLPLQSHMPFQGQTPDQGHVPAQGHVPPQMPAQGHVPPQMPAQGHVPPQMPPQGHVPPQMPPQGHVPPQMPPQMPHQGHVPPMMPPQGQGPP